MAGEVINHFNGVRIRTIGSGPLKMQFLSLSETKSAVISPITQTTSTNIEERRLTNFMQQRALLYGYTDGFGDNFQISRIVVFVKPVFGEFPR